MLRRTQAEPEARCVGTANVALSDARYRRDDRRPEPFAKVQGGSRQRFRMLNHHTTPLLLPQPEPSELFLGVTHGGRRRAAGGPVFCSRVASASTGTHRDGGHHGSERFKRFRLGVRINGRQSSDTPEPSTEPLLNPCGGTDVEVQSAKSVGYEQRGGSDK